MSASNSRPKQRTLIRWNDDLDKSLLLFINHTCTELGIKIPYDEIGRRMGANFSEGAIIQHIAKLRTKMADLNVAPVPGPPKRGQIASRPSSVYTSKTRAGPAPIPPAITSTGRGRHQRSDTARPTGVTKARPSRRGNGRKIKRSESDIEEDEEAEETDISPNPNGGQRRKSGGRATSDRRVKDAQPGPQPFNFPNYSFPNDHLAFPPTSVEHNQAGYQGLPNFALADGDIDDEELEEEEEDTLPLMALKATNQSQGQYQYSLQPSNSGNISPKSGHQMTLPLHSTNTAQSASPFSYGNMAYQQMPQARAYSSNTFSNYDYSTFDTSSNGNTSFMTPPSAFPAPVSSNMPGQASSQASSRNDSLASQTSPYDGAVISHTPGYERDQSASMNINSSPQAEQDITIDTQGALLSQAMTTLSPAQPMNFDWAYSDFQGALHTLPDFADGHVDSSNVMDYDEKACDMFFQNGQGVNLDYAEFSGSSQ